MMCIAYWQLVSVFTIVFVLSLVHSRRALKSFCGYCPMLRSAPLRSSPLCCSCISARLFELVRFVELFIVEDSQRFASAVWTHSESTKHSMRT